MYCEREVFALMERIEALGVKSRFPVPANLYRQLCGKQIYAQQCSDPEKQVPISVNVNWCDLKQNPLAAAHNALSTMRRLKRELYPAENSDINEGVVKLGFSWAGIDIMKWTEVEGLAEKMMEIVEKCTRQKGTQIIVQELVYNRLAELRVHLFALPQSEICKASGEVKTHHFEIVYVPLYKSGDLEMTHSQSANYQSGIQSPETALWTIYRGQKELQIDTELNAKKVVSKWMQWYSSMWTEPNVPPHARFDFHMSQEFKGGRENIRLFTCEVSECGVSLNLLHIECRNVSVANSCLDISEHSEFALTFGSVPKLLNFPGAIRTREKYLRYKGDPVKEGYTDWDRVVQWVQDNGGALDKELVKSIQKQLLVFGLEDYAVILNDFLSFSSC